MDTEKKTFSCVLCEFQLDSKEALQEHFRKHANKEIDAKGNPSKVFKIDKIPNEKIHTNLITCDVCPMAFENVTQAIQHKFRKHPENVAKHFCPFCGMQFPLKFTRDKHVETHKNMDTKGSYPCAECGEKFYNNQAQNYHYKSTHKRIMSIFKPVPTPPPSKKIKINNANEAQSVYYCYLCGMEYIIKFNLQKHLERSHVEAERNKVPGDLIKCITCDALFYNKKAYENHNMYHKPDDLYVTSEEQRLQTVSRVDQDFDIRRVQLVTDKFIPIDRPKRTTSKKTVSLRKPKQATKIFDDELSPTSSIESSDSETDSPNTKTNISNKSIDKMEVNNKLEKTDNEAQPKEKSRNNSKTISKNKDILQTKDEIKTIYSVEETNKIVQTKIDTQINSVTKENTKSIMCNLIDVKSDSHKTEISNKSCQNNDNEIQHKHSEKTCIKVDSTKQKSVAKQKYTAKIVKIIKNSLGDNEASDKKHVVKDVISTKRKRPNEPPTAIKRCMHNTVGDV